MMLKKRTTINNILRNSGLMSLTFIHKFIGPQTSLILKSSFYNK